MSLSDEDSQVWNISYMQNLESCLKEPEKQMILNSTFSSSNQSKYYKNNREEDLKGTKKQSENTSQIAASRYINNDELIKTGFGNSNISTPYVDQMSIYADNPNTTRFKGRKNFLIDSKKNFSHNFYRAKSPRKENIYYFLGSPNKNQAFNNEKFICSVTTSEKKLRQEIKLLVENINITNMDKPKKQNKSSSFKIKEDTQHAIREYHSNHYRPKNLLERVDVLNDKFPQNVFLFDDNKLKNYVQKKDSKKNKNFKNFGGTNFEFVSPYKNCFSCEKEANFIPEKNKNKKLSKVFGLSCANKLYCQGTIKADGDCINPNKTQKISFNFTKYHGLIKRAKIKSFNNDEFPSNNHSNIKGNYFNNANLNDIKTHKNNNIYDNLNGNINSYSYSSRENLIKKDSNFNDPYLIIDKLELKNLYMAKTLNSSSNNNINENQIINIPLINFQYRRDISSKKSISSEQTPPILSPERADEKIDSNNFNFDNISNNTASSLNLNLNVLGNSARNNNKRLVLNSNKKEFYFKQSPAKASFVKFCSNEKETTENCLITSNKAKLNNKSLKQANPNALNSSNTNKTIQKLQKMDFLLLKKLKNLNFFDDFTSLN